jgi:hypothetical protein
MSLKDKSFAELAALLRERDKNDVQDFYDRYGGTPSIEARINFVNNRAVDSLSFLSAVCEKLAEQEKSVDD